MKLITPPALKKGDKICIISPSAGIIPFTQSRSKRAMDYLKSLGYIPYFSQSSKKNQGYLSSTIEDRVRDIHSAFSNPECSLILCSIGGNHSNQLLQYIDYKIIGNNPKIFVGYSDCTVLHYAFMTQSNLQTYYGPCLLNQFGEYPETLEYTRNSFISAVTQSQLHFTTIDPSKTWTDEVLDWFTQEDEKRPRAMVANLGYKWLKKGKTEGWAFPITIPTINHLFGTKYMPDPTGAILMLDISEGHSMHEGLSISDLDSYLTDLSNVGIFSRIAGIAVGRPYKYTEEMRRSFKDILLRVTTNYNYPILFDIDMGHTDPMLSIPIGSQVLMDSTDNSNYFLIKY